MGSGPMPPSVDLGSFPQMPTPTKIWRGAQSPHVEMVSARVGGPGVKGQWSGDDPPPRCSCWSQPHALAGTPGPGLGLGRGGHVTWTTQLGTPQPRAGAAEGPGAARDPQGLSPRVVARAPRQRRTDESHRPGPDSVARELPQAPWSSPQHRRPSWAQDPPSKHLHSSPHPLHGPRAQLP